MQRKKVVTMIGRTGDGKSTLCNRMLKHKGMNQSLFSEGDAVASHTQAPKGVDCGIYTFIDNPGLMDTGGVQQDEKNIKEIVNFMKNVTYANAFILCVNAQTPRFDDGMQNALKLCVDSFGPDILTCIAIVFLRAYLVTPQFLANSRDGILRMINDRCHTRVTVLPFYYLDCHPESLRALQVPDAMINSLESTATRQLEELFRWIDMRAEYPTIDARYGEYELVKNERLAREAQEEAERKRVYEASVISSRTETQTIVTGTVTTPIYVQREGGRRYGIAGPRPRWQEHVGNHTATSYREQRRTVNTLGSGKITYGDWETVRDWTVNT